MREMSLQEIDLVDGGSLASQLDGYSDLLIAGGALAVGTGVLAGAGAFALGLGGSLKLGLILANAV